MSIRFKTIKSTDTQLGGSEEEIVHLEAHETEWKVLYDQGLTYQNNGQIHEAVNVYKKLLEDPLILKTSCQNFASPMALKIKFLVLKHMATISKDAGDNQQAFENYKKAIDLDQRDPNVLYQFGVISRSINKLNVAKNAFLASLKIHDHHWLSIQGLADTLYDLADYSQCEEFIINYALKKDSKWPYGKILLGRIAEVRNQDALYVKMPKKRMKYFESSDKSTVSHSVPLDTVCLEDFIDSLQLLVGQIQNDQEFVSLISPIHFNLVAGSKMDLIDSNEPIQSQHDSFNDPDGVFEKIEMEIEDLTLTDSSISVFPSKPINKENSLDTVQEDGVALENESSQATKENGEETDQEKIKRRSTRIQELQTTPQKKSSRLFTSFINKLLTRCKDEISRSQNLQISDVKDNGIEQSHEKEANKIPIDISVLVQRLEGKNIVEIYKILLHQMYTESLKRPFSVETMITYKKLFEILPECQFEETDLTLKINLVMAEILYSLYAKEKLIEENLLQKSDQCLVIVGSLLDETYKTNYSEHPYFYLRYLWLKAKILHKIGLPDDSCKVFRFIERILHGNNLSFYVSTSGFLITEKNASNEINKISNNQIFQTARYHYESQSWPEVVKLLLPLLNELEFTIGKSQMVDREDLDLNYLKSSMTETEVEKRIQTMNWLKSAIQKCKELNQSIATIEEEMQLYFHLLRFNHASKEGICTEFWANMLEFLSSSSLKPRNLDLVYQVLYFLTLYIEGVSEQQESEKFQDLCYVLSVEYNLLILLPQFNTRDLIKEFLIPSHKLLSLNESCCNSNGVFLITLINATEHEGISAGIETVKTLLSFDEEEATDIEGEKSEQEYTLDDEEDSTQDILIHHRIQSYACLYNINIPTKDIRSHKQNFKAISENIVNRTNSIEHMSRLYSFLKSFLEYGTSRDITYIDDSIEKIISTLRAELGCAEAKSEKLSLKVILNGEETNLKPKSVPPNLMDLTNNIFYTRGIRILKNVKYKMDRRTAAFYFKLQLSYNPEHTKSWIELAKHYHMKSFCDKHATYKEIFIIDKNLVSCDQAEVDKRRISYKKSAKCLKFAVKDSKDVFTYELYALSSFFASRYLRYDTENKLYLLKTSKTQLDRAHEINPNDWFYLFMKAKVIETSLKLENKMNLEETPALMSLYHQSSQLADSNFDPLYKLTALKLNILIVAQSNLNTEERNQWLSLLEKYPFNHDDLAGKLVFNSLEDYWQNIHDSLVYISNNCRLHLKAKTTLKLIRLFTLKPNSRDQIKPLLDSMIVITDAKINYKLIKGSENQGRMSLSEKGDYYKKKTLDFLVEYLDKFKDIDQLFILIKRLHYPQVKDTRNQAMQKVLDAINYGEFDSKERLRLTWSVFQVAKFNKELKDHAKSQMLMLFSQETGEDAVESKELMDKSMERDRRKDREKKLKHKPKHVLANKSRVEKLEVEEQPDRYQDQIEDVEDNDYNEALNLANVDLKLPFEEALGSELQETDIDDFLGECLESEQVHKADSNLSEWLNSVQLPR